MEEIWPKKKDFLFMYETGTDWGNKSDRRKYIFKNKNIPIFFSSKKFDLFARMNKTSRNKTIYFQKIIFFPRKTQI